MTDTNRAEPMKGLAEWLRKYADYADPVGTIREVDTLRRWATEVEATRPAPAQAGDTEDKWAMLARTGHLTQEVADGARKIAAVVASPVLPNCGGPANCLAICSEHTNCALKAQGQREVVAPGAAQGDAWVQKALNLAHSYAVAREWQGDAQGAYEALRAHLLAAPQAPSEAAGAAQPVAYQVKIDGKWFDCAKRAACGYGNKTLPGYRSLYDHPAPTAAPEGVDLDAILREVSRLAGNVEAAGFSRGYDKRAPSDHEREIAALVNYVRAALNREVEPRTVRMPLKEEQIVFMARQAIGADPRSQGKLAEITFIPESLVAFTRLLESAHGINSGTKGATNGNQS